MVNMYLNLGDLLALTLNWANDYNMLGNLIK